MRLLCTTLLFLAFSCAHAYSVMFMDKDYNLGKLDIPDGWQGKIIACRELNLRDPYIDSGLWCIVENKEGHRSFKLMSKGLLKPE